MFVEKSVRFVAINNGVDSNNQTDSDFTPFLNIFNEFYVKDISKKIKAVFKAKGESGKHLATIPTYGYMKNLDNKQQWVIDNEAAPVLRKIFSLCLEGYDSTQTAKLLQAEQILTPAHIKRKQAQFLFQVRLKILVNGHQERLATFWESKSISEFQNA